MEERYGRFHKTHPTASHPCPAASVHFLVFKPGEDIADVDIAAMKQGPGWACIDEERIGVIPYQNQTLMKCPYQFSCK